MVANLTQILNFKPNLHQEFELISRNKIYANNGRHFKIVSIIKKIKICPHNTLAFQEIASQFHFQLSSGARASLLDVCFEYSIANDLLFNPVKSVRMVFKPCRFKLYCPTVSIGTEPLTYVNSVKYLGFVFCENKKDDEDMLKQMRSLYGNVRQI